MSFRAILLGGMALLAVALARPASAQFTEGQNVHAADLNAALNARQPVNGDSSGQHVTARGATLSRSLADKNGDAVTPADFLLLGQTTAQLLAGAINAAPSISAALQATNGIVLPCGTYRLDGPITVPVNPAPVSLTGVGRYCVKLNINFPTGDVIATSGSSYITFAGITFFGLVPRTSGAVISVTGNFNTLLRDVLFDGQRFNDVLVYGANTTRIANSEFRPGGTGTCIIVTGSAPQAADTYIEASGINGCASGMLINNASGVYMSDVDMTGGIGSAITIAPSNALGQNVNAVRIRNVLADSSQNGHGFQVIGDGPVTELHLDSLWAGGSGNVGGLGTAFSGSYAGFYANNPRLNGAQISNLYAHFNGGAGIDIEAGTHIQLSNPMTCMNSQFTSGAANGITIAAAVDFITITNPFSGKCGYMQLVGAQTNKQGYGLFVNNNASQHVTLLGGQFDGNLTGTWLKASSEANLITAGTPP